MVDHRSSSVGVSVCVCVKCDAGAETRQEMCFCVVWIRQFQKEEKVKDCWPPSGADCCRRKDDVLIQGHDQVS